MMALLSLLIPVLLAQAEPAARLPVPDAAALTTAEVAIKDSYKDAYAKSEPADQVDLASRLAQRARALQAENLSTDRYVSFLEAQRLYAQVGSLRACFAVIDEVAALYAVEALDAKAKVVEALAKSAKSPVELRLHSKGRLLLADALARGDFYDEAEKSVQAAVAAARKSATASTIARAVAKGKEIADHKGQFEKTKKARETLAATPDDAPSNLALGRFRWLVQGNWENGLPHLAKGNDAILKGLAAKDLASPEAAADQLALADEWWAAAEKAPAPTRDPLRRRAVTWYERAVPKLPALDKPKANAKVLEYSQQQLLKGAWTEMMEPKLYGLPPGKPGAPFQIAPLKRLSFSSFPKGDFDGLTLRCRPFTPGAGSVLIEFQKDKRALGLDFGTGAYSTQRMAGGPLARETGGTTEVLPEHTLTLVVEEDECIIYINGREKLRLPSTVDRLDFFGASPGAGGGAGDVLFDQIKMRRKDP